VLFFHGTPASKHNWHLGHDPRLLEELNLRVLALDRPGLGGSTYQRGRTLQDWVQDVQAFADQLELDGFSLLGYSGGSSFALACALGLGERVKHTTIVSGMVDLTHPSLASFPPQQNNQVMRLGSTKPWASRLVYRMMSLSARYTPNMMIKQLLAMVPPADQEVIMQPEVRQAFLTMLHETFAQGPRGAQQDSAIVTTAWGLELENIRGRVRLWHGDADMNVPVAMWRHFANRLPNAEFTVIADEGHLSLIHRHAREILGAIAAEAAVA
jgi:pimeloyl-ACP methyl ester carboxylesterase